MYKNPTPNPLPALREQGGFIQQAEKKLYRVDLIRHVELEEWFGNQKNRALVILIA